MSDTIANGPPTVNGSSRCAAVGRPTKSSSIRPVLGDLISVARSGKPVTNQVTTPPVDTGPRQHQPDSDTALNCTDATQRDRRRPNERPW